MTGLRAKCLANHFSAFLLSFQRFPWKAQSTSEWLVKPCGLSSVLLAGLTLWVWFGAGTVPRFATRDVYLAVGSCLHLALITCNTEREKAAAWPRLCQSANTRWTVHVPAWFQRLLLRGFDKFTKTNTVGAFKHQSWLFFLRGNRIQTPRPNNWKRGPKKVPSSCFFLLSSLRPITPSSP